MLCGRKSSGSSPGWDAAVVSAVLLGVGVGEARLGKDAAEFCRATHHTQPRSTSPKLEIKIHFTFEVLLGRLAIG